MAEGKILGASEIPAVKLLETLQALLKRVTEDGKIDKQELQDIILRMNAEKLEITGQTVEALNKLKSEGLHDILENGLTLKQGDKVIMDELKTQGYTLSPQVEKHIKNQGDFLVTLGGPDKKTVIAIGMLNLSSNDDQTKIRDNSEKILKLERKVEKTPEQIMADTRKSEEQKKAIDAFKGKSLEEMISSNEKNITDSLKQLQDRYKNFGTSPADINNIKSIDKLISRYKEVEKLAENMRKVSIAETETHKKENEVGLYQNNIYGLNQEANDFLIKT